MEQGKEDGEELDEFGDPVPKAPAPAPAQPPPVMNVEAPIQPPVQPDEVQVQVQPLSLSKSSYSRSYSGYSSSYSSSYPKSKSKPPPPPNNNNNNGGAMLAPCQIGVIPMRSAAFQAPCIPLPNMCRHLLEEPDVDDDEDGVAFQFKPQENCRTEVTFTIEPKPQPAWLTMLNCGFKPMVNCSAPPCYLSPSGNPGMNYVGGSQSYVNSAYGSQVSYAGMANYPTLSQISGSLQGSRISGSGSGSGSFRGSRGRRSGSFAEGRAGKRMSGSRRSKEVKSPPPPPPPEEHKKPDSDEGDDWQGDI